MIEENNFRIEIALFIKSESLTVDEISHHMNLKPTHSGVKARFQTDGGPKPLFNSWRLYSKSDTPKYLPSVWNAFESELSERESILSDILINCSTEIHIIMRGTGDPPDITIPGRLMSFANRARVEVRCFFYDYNE